MNNDPARASGQNIDKTSRVESGRVGRCPKFHGSGRVGSGRVGSGRGRSGVFQMSRTGSDRPDPIRPERMIRTVTSTANFRSRVM